MPRFADGAAEEEPPGRGTGEPVADGGLLVAGAKVVVLAVGLPEPGRTVDWAIVTGKVLDEETEESLEDDGLLVVGVEIVVLATAVEELGRNDVADAMVLVGFEGSSVIDSADANLASGAAATTASHIA
ncbi:hypothetical protein MMC18_003767 [Xylographa bjoerkii]|nr:hypothetical protein [Xylographa bjoerkii]